MTFRNQLLGGLWSRAHMSPVEDAGAAAVAAESATPAPAAADPEAGQNHEAGDAADAAGATREADDADARGEAPAEPKPTRQPWQDKRINKLTADAKAAQEARERAESEAAEARRQLAAYQSVYGTDAVPAGGGAPAPAAGGDRTYTQAEVLAEANRIASVNVLNQRIDSVFDAGLKARGADWNARVNAAGAAFGADLQQRPDLFEALTALPNADAVYYELAGDLDHMGEVLSMPPVQLGMELARLSAKAGARGPGPAVSRAPAPITPLDATAPDEVPLDKMPMEDYAKTRAAQLAARDAARR